MIIRSQFIAETKSNNLMTNRKSRYPPITQQYMGKKTKQIHKIQSNLSFWMKSCLHFVWLLLIGMQRCLNWNRIFRVCHGFCLSHRKAGSQKPESHDTWARYHIHKVGSYAENNSMKSNNPAVGFQDRCARNIWKKTTTPGPGEYKIEGDYPA